MKEVRSDVVVVGSGVAGLWSAKELVDQGASVHVVEKADTIAAGATTRNEGWLHAGTYHSVAIQDETAAQQVTERTLYGHDAIVEFAPESIDESTSFALIADPLKVDEALGRWNQYEINYEEVNPQQLRVVDNIDPNRVSAAFRVNDKSVDTTKLCGRLVEYLVDKGCRFSTGVTFTPDDEGCAWLENKQSELELLKAEQFLITVGTGIKGLLEQLDDQDRLVRFYKAHLLVFRQLTKHNYFYIDENEAGIMNHGRVSIVGINRDGIEQDSPDRTVDPNKARLVYNAITRMLPSTVRQPLSGKTVQVVACCKPDVYESTNDTQSLNARIIEVSPGYTIALPGKMTEAPFLGQHAMRHLLSSAAKQDQPRLPIINLDKPDLPPQVTRRPADDLISNLNDRYEQMSIFDAYDKIG